MREWRNGISCQWQVMFSSLGRNKCFSICEQNDSDARHQRVVHCKTYIGASGGMVDALASGASVLLYVEVQVLSRAPWSDSYFSRENGSRIYFPGPFFLYSPLLFLVRFLSDSVGRS